MANEKFYIDFISDGTGVVQIDEPIGFNAITFDFMQKSNGYGRNHLFNDGEAQMEFTDERNHYVDKLYYYFHHFGYEAEAQLIIEAEDGTQLTTEIDFYTASSDDLKSFKCKVIEKTSVLLIDRR